MTEERFRDRVHAGQRLAGELTEYAHKTDVVVLGLPRGGVPVAFEVAQALNAKLDVFLVRKLGVPGHEELAMGAIASGDIRVMNEQVMEMLRVPDHVVDAVIHYDQTRALEPLERTPLWEGGEPPETYPSGL